MTCKDKPVCKKWTLQRFRKTFATLHHEAVAPVVATNFTDALGTGSPLGSRMRPANRAGTGAADAPRVTQKSRRSHAKYVIVRNLRKHGWSKGIMNAFRLYLRIQRQPHRHQSLIESLLSLIKRRLSSFEPCRSFLTQMRQVSLLQLSFNLLLELSPPFPNVTRTRHTFFGAD